MRAMTNNPVYNNRQNCLFFSTQERGRMSNTDYWDWGRVMTVVLPFRCSVVIKLLKLIKSGKSNKRYVSITWRNIRCKNIGIILYFRHKPLSCSHHRRIQRVAVVGGSKCHALDRHDHQISPVMYTYDNPKVVSHHCANSPKPMVAWHERICLSPSLT